MDFHPDAALNALDQTPVAADSGEHTLNCWNAMIGEAHKVIQVTLEELALLAGLATADTDEAGGTHAEAPGHSAYSLLLDPGLFNFRR
jgi:hypothetical protein